MSIIENILYGFISGVSEFLPVSSHAHQVLLRYLLGVESRNPMQDFLVHMGILVAVLFGCRDLVARLRREQRSIARTRNNKNKSLDLKSYYDLRLLKTALLPLIICLLLIFKTYTSKLNLISLIFGFLFNALILFIADHMRRGNRDARTMTSLDGIAMGVLGGFSVFSGISRTGMISAYTIARGADYKNSINWAYVLAIPAIIFFLCFDLIGIFTIGSGLLTFAVFLGYLLAGVFAFLGGYLSISLLQIILTHYGFGYFAYYSIATALFTFALFLIT